MKQYIVFKKYTHTKVRTILAEKMCFDINTFTFYLKDGTKQQYSVHSYYFVEDPDYKE